MQKIGRLAEMALLRLNGGKISADTELTFQEVVVAIGFARDYLLQTYFWNNKAKGEGDIDGVFIKPYDNQTVLFDTNKNMFYSLLPSQVIGLVNDLGVYQILFQEDQSSAFIRLPNGSLSLISGLDIGNEMYNYPCFFKESDKVYYPFMKKADGVKKVLMKLIPSASGLAESDFTYMVAEMEQQVVDMVVQTHMTEKQMPVDNINDNAKM